MRPRRSAPLLVVVHHVRLELYHDGVLNSKWVLKDKDKREKWGPVCIPLARQQRIANKFYLLLPSTTKYTVSMRMGATHRKSIVRDVLKAGAHSCLMLPINAKDVASMLVHAQAGNQPGRHTRDLEKAQTEDRWRDDGGM